MCGFAGIISNNINKVNLERINNYLNHRDQDVKGYFFDPKKVVGLGHRRFCIIDLSEDANQPMNSHCGIHKIVYKSEFLIIIVI